MIRSRMENSGTIQVSVIVCTRNRAATLARTLESLVSQSLDSSQYEIIVVDNNSTDDTKDVITRFNDRFPLHTEYVYEPRQGLSCARNSGLRSAQAPIVAFTDDDVIATPNWLELIACEFLAVPELQALGGKVEPWSKENPQLCTTPLEVREVYRSKTRLVGFIHGNNMAFRRSIFNDVGLFDERLGAGTSCCAGEDIDILYRILQSGHIVVYSPLPTVFHDHAPMTESEMLRQLQGYAKGYGAFLMKHMLGGDSYVVRLFIEKVRKLRWQYMRATQQADHQGKAFIRKKLRAVVSGMGLMVKAQAKEAIMHIGKSNNGMKGRHPEILLRERRSP